MDNQPIRKGKRSFANFTALTEGNYQGCKIEDIEFNFDNESFDDEVLQSMDVKFAIAGHKVNDRMFGISDVRFQAFLKVLAPFMDANQAIDMDELSQRTLSLGVENYAREERTYTHTRDWKFDETSPLPTSIQSQVPDPEFYPNNIGY